MSRLCYECSLFGKPPCVCAVSEFDPVCSMFTPANMTDKEYIEIEQLEKAIDTLAGYCDSRSCEDCTFHTADNICILNNCTPLEWPVHWGDDL